MDKTEAVAAMGDIETTQRRARARAQHKGADIIYFIWGVIWFVAFTVQHMGVGISFRLGPVSFNGSGLVWTPLVLLGIVLTVIIARRQETVHDKDGWKFGVLWPIVFGYVYLWMFLLSPMIQHEMLATEEGMLRMTAIISTIPMCIYVLAGIMEGEGWIAGIGAAITVLTGIGVYLVHDYFYLWMAVFGGGGLMLAGYISRRKWKNA